MSAHRVWPSVASGLLLAAGVSEERADFASAPQRLADEALVGPVSAVVERVVDGDTVDVRAHIWLGQTLTVRVRIDGVDAPETRSDCADERRLAAAARDYLAHRLLNKGDRSITRRLKRSAPSRSRRATLASRARSSAPPCAVSASSRR